MNGIRVVKRTAELLKEATTHLVIVTNQEEVQHTSAELGLGADVLMTRMATSVDAATLAAFVDIHLDEERRPPSHVVLHMFNVRMPYNSMRAIARALAAIGGDVCVHVRHVPPGMRVPLMHVTAKHCYAFSKYRTGHNHTAAPKRRDRNDRDHQYINVAPKRQYINVAHKRTIWIFDQLKLHEAYLEDAANALSSADIARDLENEPANRMTPHKFCVDAVKLLTSSSKSKNMKITVMDEKQMKDEGLGLVLSVGQSSSYPPRFMAVECIKDSRLPTVCLIGKGVTFDAGGLRIKSAPGMIDMKQDKSGAAVVVAIMCHMAKHHPDLPVNIVGLMPMVENVINGKATKPGDIVTAHNGSNVEIMDPDAEGRLILADAISYSSRYKPDYVLDFATLTNFATTLCCDLSAVYYTVSDPLSQLIYRIGESIGERVWRHPPWPEYHVNTISPVADTRNAIFECTRSGSFMASMFISNFVQREVADRWVHFDIANNDVRGIHSANCAFLGMQLVCALSEVGTKIIPKTKSHRTSTSHRTSKSPRTSTSHRTSTSPRTSTSHRTSKSPRTSTSTSKSPRIQIKSNKVK